MRRAKRRHLVLANGATGPPERGVVVSLDYLEGRPSRRVRIGLPRFVQDVYHLKERILDLLELASYAFAMDRLISRGRKDALEYHRWGRSIDFYMRVRDFDFWSQASVANALRAALLFMTGDEDIMFHFEPGHSTPPTNLFDAPGFSLDAGTMGLEVTLFSGGVDSLAGALELLTSRTCKVILVSHLSQPGTRHTQNALVNALQSRFPGRVLRYGFDCTLRDTRAVEETQRSRSFLYTSIAYAIASSYGLRQFTVYENGVTSINLRRREDLANARASRTTHPQTISQLAKLFSMIEEREVTIKLPYLFCTKADVMRKVMALAPELLASAVSCSRTFQTTGQTTHCGRCVQCVDRRIAAHAVGAEDLDHLGLYTSDIIGNPIVDREAKTTAVDYIRQAIPFAKGSADWFYSEYLSDLAEVLDYLDLPGGDAEKVAELWKLFNRHGRQVRQGIDRMRCVHEDVFGPLVDGSLLSLISSREYLKPEVERLAENLVRLVKAAMGDMFAGRPPVDEADLNQKLGALLRSHEPKLASEHPTVSFACAGVVPDHSDPGADLLVEAKYVRESTSPSKATEAIAADLTKYRSDAFIVFVVYDPQHRIRSDVTFVRDIEGKGRNRVLIIR